MTIPLNGRIAIVENDLTEAMPLFETLSQNEMPYVFYKGDEKKFLPEKDSSFNDIRLLFLDLNLIDKGKPNSKLIKSTLYGVLSRIISVDNYPYTIILWSKQESDYKDVLDELFKNELVDRAPISIHSFVKADFFSLDGTSIPNQLDLIQKINIVLEKDLAYSYLLNWENNVHRATDNTLHEIFSSYHSYDNWSDNANYLLTKLGISFSGSHFDSQSYGERIRSSYNALNIVFIDTLENRINTEKIVSNQDLTVSDKAKNLETVYNINRKLLISEEITSLHYSGSIIEIVSENVNSEYEKLLDVILKKKGSKDNIIKSWRKIWLNVTPLCDTVQGKVAIHRLVKGIMVKEEHAKAFFSNEAVFVSPVFSDGDNNYSIVLDFRYFFTLDKLGFSKFRKPLFRIRQQLLAEIQSKLARHVNRQGVLFLDNK